MHGISPKDGDRTINWGNTSPDYSEFRPGPPSSFYARLMELGVGLPGQSILDLGTGTGALARQFARQGAKVTGADISDGQIKSAEQLALSEGLSIRFIVAPAECLPWTSAEFDVVTANQCWLYFDKAKAIGELRRVLKPGGCLVTSHFSWLPRLDEIARASEALVLRHNPDWSAADWSGDIPEVPDWAAPFFNVRAMFIYDEPIDFTRETWRGRIRACRGIGATMTAEEVAAFDAAHDQLLRKIAPESFTVLHRIDAHVFEFKD
jgi:SAM-dependent methyltransferase